jgi:Bacterial protein of unknown function (DUF922)
MKIVFWITLWLLNWNSSVSEDEKILWNAEQQLTWEDFRGVPNGADAFVASTNSGISFTFSYQEINGRASVTYTVRSNFYPKLSWYKPERVSAYILKHEQTHFDISELFARKLRKALSAIKEDPNFRQLAEEKYHAIELQRREMQLRYDKESDHSNMESQEYQWRSFVAQQLKEFEDWK